MKSVFIIVLTLGLLLSYTTFAAAEILFGVSAAGGVAALTADYRDAADISKSAGVWVLNGNINLLGSHLRLEYGAYDMSPYKLTSSMAKAGWDIGLPAVNAEIFAGYQQLIFTDDTKSAGNRNSFGSISGGLRIESRINRFTLCGAASFPLKTYYNNGVTEDYNAGLNDFAFSASYTPMPLVDIFIAYRSWAANSNAVNLAMQSYTAGIKISF